MSYADHLFATSARVLTTRATPEELAVLAARAALDPAVFEDNPPFFFPAEISSDRLDAYFTRMDSGTTLANYAREAAEGVAFLAAHRRMELPFGRSLTGTLETLNTSEVAARVRADFYVIPGLMADAARSSDQIITAIRAGVQRDVSIGFYGGFFRCSICGNDLMDWRACTHFPGVTYETKGTDNVVRQAVCTATVEDAHLAEVSAVYDGATPGAVILKAGEAAETGRLAPAVRHLLEHRYRMRLPERQRVFAAAVVAEKGNEMPPDDEVTTAIIADDAAATTLRQIMTTLDEAGAPADLLAPTRVRWLADEAARLRPLADDGRAYRADLVSEALAEGVRALGQSFAEETYRQVLEIAPLEVVKRMRDDWRSQGDARLPGGRASRDSVDPVPQPVSIGLPDHIYRH